METRLRTRLVDASPNDTRERTERSKSLAPPARASESIRRVLTNPEARQGSVLASPRATWSNFRAVFDHIGFAFEGLLIRRQVFTGIGYIQSPWRYGIEKAGRLKLFHAGQMADAFQSELDQEGFSCAIGDRPAGRALATADFNPAQ